MSPCLFVGPAVNNMMLSKYIIFSAQHVYSALQDICEYSRLSLCILSKYIMVIYDHSSLACSIQIHNTMPYLLMLVGQLFILHIAFPSIMLLSS